LIQFQHQIKNAIVIKDSMIMNITGGTIYIESLNKNNVEIPTKVKFENITVADVNSKFSSFLLLQQGAILEIHDSKFLNNFWYESGSIIFAGYQYTNTSIFNTIFENNTAVNGGVFNIESQSILQLYNWTIINNFAITGGVIYASQNGYFEIYSSNLNNNLAYSSSLFELFYTMENSVISNCTIYSNTVIKKEKLLTELYENCINLWHLKEDYKSYLKSNIILINFQPTEYSLTSIYGEYTITNHSYFHTQDKPIYAFASNISIEKSIFTNIHSTSSCLTFILSTLNLTNITITNITTPSTPTHFLSITVNSISHLNHLNFQNNSIGLVLLHTSKCTISNLHIHNISTTAYLLDIISSYGIQLQHSRVYDIPKQDAVRLKNTDVQVMNNVTLTNISHTAIKIQSSHIQNITNLTITSCKQAIFITDSAASLVNSTFEYIGGDSNLIGGALAITNSNITISTSLFNHNTAQSGAGISFQCSIHLACYSHISHSTFTNNIALVKGGAILFDLYPPVLVNNLFENNTALYGKDIASYPVRVIFANSSSYKNLIKLKIKI
jgi:hypothetical protein